MGKIIIFENEWNKALDSNLDNLVLFGERDFIADENGSYDLVFYSKQCSPYDKPKIREKMLTIPVLRSFNEENIISQIYHINAKYPDFDRFVGASKEFLDFYDAKRVDFGREINPLGKYNVVEEKKFINHFGSRELLIEIEKRRSFIDQFY